MYDANWEPKSLQLGLQVIFAEAVPGRFLHASHDPKGGEIVGLARVYEVAGDPELEEALAVCLRVALTESRGGQRFASRDQLRGIAPPAEVLVEFHPVPPVDGRRADECEPSRGGE